MTDFLLEPQKHFESDLLLAFIPLRVLCVSLGSGGNRIELGNQGDLQNYLLR